MTRPRKMARREATDADALIRQVTACIREALPSIAAGLGITPRTAALYAIRRIAENLLGEEDQQ